jgi:hypothetical protein
MRTIPEKVFQSRSLNLKTSCQGAQNIASGTFSANLQKLILILYCLLKMSQGKTVPAPDLELINTKSLDFTKPKLFFKSIGRYAAMSTDIHVQIPFNFTQILGTKNTIKENYFILLDRHEEPFKMIIKTTSDVSLMTIAASIEDFQDIIKALAQIMEIATPGKRSFNVYRIMQLNSEILAFKSKMDLLVDISHLHEAHLHHLEDETDATNKLLNDMLESNIWFTSKLMDAIEKKFQLGMHHHENVVKSAQHHCLTPGALSP